MGIKVYKKTSPGRRFSSVNTFEDVTGTASEKSLLRPLKKKGGRNFHGIITSRHRGGGSKRQYRLIDFRRDKDGMAAEVVAVEYDPTEAATSPWCATRTARRGTFWPRWD